MNPRVKGLFLAALRSGEYKQGQHALHSRGRRDTDENLYCCLGVLTDLYDRERIAAGHPTRWCEYNMHMVYLDEGGIREISYLPPEVQRWAGLDSCNPVVGAHTLTSLNDVSNANFQAIASMIEEYL